MIGDFTNPEGERVGFGSLLLGYFEADKLRYAGRVGTGFDQRVLELMRRELERIERGESLFSDRVDDTGVHWVEPHRVAEVRFTEWTDDDKLRHPRFMGERDDKNASDVVREEQRMSTGP